MSVDALRYYEKRRLLGRARRSTGGFRLFAHEAVERVLFIKQAQPLGFSLAEIGELLATGGAAECRKVRDLLRTKLGELDERMEVSENSARSKRTIAASLGALGSVVLASSCCLPLLPFLFAAGTAGTSAFFVKARPFLLAASVLLVAFGFYQRWRAKQCQCKPNLLSAILLWFSAFVVLVFILFPQAIANLVANLLAG